MNGFLLKEQNRAEGCSGSSWSQGTEFTAYCSKAAGELLSVLGYGRTDVHIDNVFVPIALQLRHAFTSAQRSLSSTALLRGTEGNEPHPERWLHVVSPSVGGCQGRGTPRPTAACQLGPAHLPFTQVSDGLQRPSSNRQPGEEKQKRERSQCYKQQCSCPGPLHLPTPERPRNKADPHRLFGFGFSEMMLNLETWLESLRGSKCTWPGVSIGRTLAYVLSLLATGRGRLPKDTFQSSRKRWGRAIHVDIS